MVSYLMKEYQESKLNAEAPQGKTKAEQHNQRRMSSTFLNSLFKDVNMKFFQNIFLAFFSP